MIKGKDTLDRELTTLGKELTVLTSNVPSFSCDARSELKAIRHLKECEELLKKVTFLTFDVKEWIVENDSFVCQLKAQQEGGLSTLQQVVDSFENLLQRVQGLPPESSCTCYEQAISYNLSHLLLQGHIHHLLVGGLHRSTSVLNRSLLRACEALEVDSPSNERDVDGMDSFSPVNLNHTQGLLSSLFQALTKTSIGCAPLALSTCLLAFLWLLEGHASEAVQLLHQTKCQLFERLKDVNLSTTEKEPDSFPIFLFNLEYIPSVTNCLVSSSTRDLADIQNMLSVVTSLLAFCHFSNKEYNQALKILNERRDTQDTAFNDLYLKGFIFYMRSEVDEALMCFQQCIRMSHGRDRAAVLNMLGCCCATKGKHHTAVAKFREALEQDFQQLEALFNISLQYRKLGCFSAEIQSLKLLKQAAKCREKNRERRHDTPVLRIPSNCNNDFKEELIDVELTVPPRFGFACGMSGAGVTKEFITYVLARRCVELERFEDAAEVYLELLNILLEMHASSCVNPSHLPSPLELYRQCAFSLLKAGRYGDTVTVCNKVLYNSSCDFTPTAQDPDHATTSKDTTREHDKGAKKRLRSGEEEQIDRHKVTSENVVILLYKADALIKLQQSLEALQSLNRVLKALKGVYSATCHSGEQSEEEQREQKRKKRKLEFGESGNSSVSTDQDQECQLNKLVRIKVQAYNKKAMVLEGLGQAHDALQQLHLSLECLPENPETVFNHTQLLFKLGSHKEAAFNWLRFRDVDTSKHKVDVQSMRNSLGSSTVNLSKFDVTQAQVEAMDEMALKWWSKADHGFHS